MVFSRAVYLIASVWIAMISGAADALSSQSMSPALMSKVRAAMATTTASQSNVAKAYEACDIWDELQFGDLPESVRAISSVLHATCLARVGRDDDALEAYQSCLTLKGNLEGNTVEDVKIGRASALQRLMRYDEAITQYLDSESDRGTMGAVTCCLRLGELERAVQLIQERPRSNGVETRAMFAVLKMLQGNSMDAEGSEALNNAAASPLFQWMSYLTPAVVMSDRKEYEHLEVAAINQSPLDDPLLLNLDDKVKLHQLLARVDSLFWPTGFIVPDELDAFRQHARGSGNTKDWILKSRAGYGSHGNQILTGNEIKSYTESMEPCLCQQLVDPPLLLDGRKFSMRVYVYYFTDGCVYLSDLGLVKLASEVYRDGVDDDRIHMTNSGREETMLQYDFAYLRVKFQEAGWSYDDFWVDIGAAVKTTMSCYNNYCDTQKSAYRPELARQGLPKILGFDFMVTESLQPMLLEVNRFPGLEPRGDGDELVKQTVVREAWVCASERMGTIGIVDRLAVNEEVSYKKLM